MVTLSTLGQNNLVRSELAMLQGGIQDLQTQVATGEKTQRYGDLGAQAAVSGTQVTAQGDGVTTTWPYGFDIPTAADAVVKIVDTTVTPPTTTVLTPAQYAITGLGSLTGGTVTPTGPALTAGQYITIQQAAPLDSATGHYLRCPAHTPNQISQGLSVDYSITADDPAFLTLMQGLYTLAALPQPSGPTATPPALSDSDFDAAASAAASTISQGLTQLQSLTEKNGRTEQLLTEQSTTHDATLTVLQTQIDNIEQVNLADASTRLTQLKTQLDASYHIVADLSSLNRIGFLK